MYICYLLLANIINTFESTFACTCSRLGFANKELIIVVVVVVEVSRITGGGARAAAASNRNVLFFQRVPFVQGKDWMDKINFTFEQILRQSYVKKKFWSFIYGRCTMKIEQYFLAMLYSKIWLVNFFVLTWINKNRRKINISIYKVPAATATATATCTGNIGYRPSLNTNCIETSNIGGITGASNAGPKWTVVVISSKMFHKLQVISII